MKIQLASDGYKINGPKVDGNWTVTFNVGEYEVEEIAKLLMLPKDTMLKVTIEVNVGLEGK